MRTGLPLRQFLRDQHVIDQINDLAQHYRDRTDPVFRLIGVPTRGDRDARTMAARRTTASVFKAADDLIRAIGQCQTAPEFLQWLEASGLASPRMFTLTLHEIREYCRPTDGEQGRGRPVNLHRQYLERNTARILAAAGVPLKKSRDGVLARALEHVYETAGERVPLNLMPVLVRVVKDQQAHDAAVRRGVRRTQVR
jgi:hypothetical protein